LVIIFFDEKFFEDDQYTPTMIDIVDSQKITEAVDQGSPIQEETPQEEVIQTAALPQNIPTPAQTSGLEGIQARQNYESLFPQDTIGAALAKRGTV